MHLWFTYGPSVDDEEVLRKVLLAGATGCRLTFSFGTRALQEDRGLTMKRLAADMEHPCLVVADLAGEKIRLGDFAQPQVAIKSGERVTLRRPGTTPDIITRLFPITSHRLFANVKAKDRIVIGDGSLLLEIAAVSDDDIEAFALYDGVINPNRGLMMQSGSMSPTCLTSKDIEDLEHIARSTVYDMVALSFVSDPADVERARKIIRKADRDMPIIAKIETAQGLRNLYAITDAADMIMAARGDLATAIDWVELPSAVELIARVAGERNKPWVLATQIVEGLERFALPSRAEICDLAHWLNRSASGVMVSYETAFGRKPVEAIIAVNRMIERWGV